MEPSTSLEVIRNQFNQNEGGSISFPASGLDSELKLLKNIIYKNSVILVPEGEDSTFIKSVLLHNFERWFPAGLTVILNDSWSKLQLMYEQIFRTVPVDRNQCAVLNGHITIKRRERDWKEKRVLLVTPIIFLNDMERKLFNGNQISLLIMDGVGRAAPQSTYSKLIAAINGINQSFRVAVFIDENERKVSVLKEAFRKLRIDNVGLLPDQKSKLQTISVDIGQQIKDFADSIQLIMDQYAAKLLQNYKIDISSMKTKEELLKARVIHEQAHVNTKTEEMEDLQRYFDGCIELAFGLELLFKNGINLCYKYLSGLGETCNLKQKSSLLQKSISLCIVIDNMRQHLSAQSYGTPCDFIQLHPKYGALKDVILKFTSEKHCRRIAVISKDHEGAKELQKFVRVMEKIEGHDQAQITVLSSEEMESVDGEPIYDLVIYFEKMAHNQWKANFGSTLVLLTRNSETMEMSEETAPSLESMKKLLCHSSPRVIPDDFIPDSMVFTLILPDKSGSYNKGECSKRTLSEESISHDMHPKKRKIEIVPKQKTQANPFVITMADVSGSEGSSSPEELTTGDDDSFLADDELSDSSVDQIGFYLESIKNLPLGRVGKVEGPLAGHDSSNESLSPNESYIRDSFCVDDTSSSSLVSQLSSEDSLDSSNKLEDQKRKTRVFKLNYSSSE